MKHLSLLHGNGTLLKTTGENFIPPIRYFVICEEKVKTIISGHMMAGF